jgi:superfamily II DNA or RNA helicase/SAM-dependent methyltransferase/SOS-response transcriptional repressor LexA
MPDTIAYYDRHAARYVDDTLAVDMSALHARFLAHVPNGGLILDAGCGSGRDSKAFLVGGYRVHAFDASQELVYRAAELLGQPVAVRRFADFSDAGCYDGIWACASLLHVPAAELPDIFGRLWAGLKPGGALYVSFKQGDGERTDGERHFTDATEVRLKQWLADLDDIHAIDCWITRDQRPQRDESWLNAIIQRNTHPKTRLITGDAGHPFLPQLCKAIARADEIDLAVSFVKVTGLRLLLPDLHDALGQHEVRARPATRLRVLTSDYLDITDPEALRLLMLLQEQGAQVRVFEAAGRSFHMKAYLFAHFAAERNLHGTAFIGSSNISRQALTDGLEWNYRIDYPGDDGFVEARARYEELFRDPRTVALTDAWIDRYEARRIPPSRAIAPGSEETEPPPVPTPIQAEALDALSASRREGYRRGLVVLATGLGKTWLAAFDAEQIGARRVLFVAHREEILHQAAETFVRIRPHARVGFYKGQVRDAQVDVLCASVQTLGQHAHLERFSPRHFDYIVIDEFHHAAAPTYRRLLAHVLPQFLLGLTATPDRTDQSDILSLCDDNLVFNRNLFAGIEAGLLAPFHYFGIWDESVDYREIPWRNGRFEPEQLSNKLATLARARHALRHWRDRAQQRTLAFCVSIRHAEFMAAQFAREGIAAAAVYAGSALPRSEALDRLKDGRLQVIFSVDLFNEGVDLPSIDTVLMLRPTESKILFLQQLGRGLRRAEGKQQLVVLDFIGNHHSFLHKPQALAQIGTSYKQLAEFARKVEARRIELPPGCFINYDIELIDFLKSLDSDGTTKDYAGLKDGLGRRPTLAEFYRCGANLKRMRKEYGSWFELVHAMEDLDSDEAPILTAYRDFLRELENTAMTKSFKMVLLEALQELDGWSTAPSLTALAERSWQVLQRRRPLLTDLSDALGDTADGTNESWQRYWRDNPVRAWTGGNQPATAKTFFHIREQPPEPTFEPTFDVAAEHRERFAVLVQELVDYRLAAYEVRRTAGAPPGNVIPFRRATHERTELPYFPNLRIACGHFRTARADAEEHRSLGPRHGRLDPARHFIARASGNSMNGGKQPIKDGDYLLLELVTPANSGSITGSTMAIERQDQTGDDQYLLRVVTKNRDGSYVLVANNPDYDDLHVTPELASELRTLARLKAVIGPLELAIGESFMREDIPTLFNQTFNPGNWNTGQVVLPDQNAHVLLITLNKQGKAQDHRYLDHWIDDHTFHWQSQNATTPDSKRGREIIEHEKRGITLHLFVRDAKLAGGKASPFVYHGAVRYRSHTGSAPMSVVFEVDG